MKNKLNIMDLTLIKSLFNKNKVRTFVKGFTLTEVLITLGVLGVVSALTVPQLLNRYNEKNFAKMTSKTKLNILNTLDMLMTDEGKSTLSASGMRTDDGVKSYLTTYYRVNTVCGDNPSSKKCLASGSYTNKAGSSVNYPADLQCIKANDGATICMSPLNADNEGEVFVDTNAAQGPNVEGKDIFRLTYDNLGQFGGDDALVGPEYVLKVVRDSGVESVTPTQKALSEDESTTVSATFDAGWELKSYELVSGTCSVGASTGKVVMGTTDCTVKVSAQKIKYQLTVEQGSCDTASGSASPIYYNDTQNISASPELLGSFGGWTISGNCSVANASNKDTTVTIQGNCTLTPACSPAPSYAVNITAGKGISSVSPNSYNEKIGRDRTITVTPSEGYSFSEFTTNSNCSASGSKITMSKNSSGACTVTANGTQNSYNLTVNGGDGGTVSGSGSVKYEDTATITATPDSEYSFAGWSGTCNIADTSSATTTVTMGASDCTVTASFTQNTYTLTVNAGNGGSASGGASGLKSGDKATITATASSGYTFNGWSKSGSCTVDGSVVTMGAGNCTVTANFDEISVSDTDDDDDDDDVEPDEPVKTKEYNINISAAEICNGSCTGPNCTTTCTMKFTTTTDLPVSLSTIIAYDTNIVEEYGYGQSGSEMTKSYTTSGNSSVDDWAWENSTDGDTYGSGDYYLNTGESSITGLTFKVGESSTKSSFQNGTFQLGEYNVKLNISDSSTSSTTQYYTLSVNSETGGSATGGGNYKNAEVAAISATPNTGYRFSQWSVTSGSCTIDNPLLSSANVTMGGDNCVITANFAQGSYTLTASAGTGGTVTPTSSTVKYKDTKTVTAVADSGYKFKEWSVTSGSCTISDTTAIAPTVTMGAGNCTVTATFSENSTYTLTVKTATYGSMTEITAGGFVDTPGPYSLAEGETQVLTAKSSYGGYTFHHWGATGCTASGASANTSTTVTMKAQDCTVTAYFAKSGSSSGGSSSGSTSTGTKNINIVLQTAWDGEVTGCEGFCVKALNGGIAPSTEIKVNIKCTISTGGNTSITWEPVSTLPAGANEATSYQSRPVGSTALSAKSASCSITSVSPSSISGYTIYY